MTIKGPDLSYKELYQAVLRAGFKANEQPQEKLEPKEVYMQLTNIVPEFETTDAYTASYIFHFTVWFNFDVDEPDDIIPTMITFVQKVHHQVQPHPSFMFGKADITPLGQYYRISIPCMWKQYVYTS